MDVGFITGGVTKAPVPTSPPELDWKAEMDRKMRGIQKQLGQLLSRQKEQRVEPAPPPRQAVAPPPRPDRRRWDPDGTPYCLRCGQRGHMIRECGRVNAVNRPQDQRAPAQGN